ncbi:putative porin [Vibrio sp. ES.051]|uniref:porin n=1 Tax=Vibrio sp. ES.051 TaxID=1761909 RepID=UPI000BF3485D|nr:porin [Vibrio sp. ES.051]PFG46067.1 putative porin [Vibrio sp. ES.051]
MDKMIKRTLLGAAIASVAAAGSANAAVQLAGENFEIYGTAAAYNMFITNDADGKDSTNTVGIESKIGFKGKHVYEDFGADFLWQIESGWASHDDSSWASDRGILGGRDTFIGLGFDAGNLKIGRMTHAAYDIVDWPHSNPGLGNVFDWNNDLGAGFQDRADNMIRFESAAMGPVKVNVTASGMESSTSDIILSGAVYFTQDMFGLHAGYYNRGEAEDKSFADHSYAIVGGNLYLDKLTLSAAYKMMEYDGNDQNAISATAQYMFTDKFLAKLGYASTDEADGTKDTDDQAITARLGYLLPSTYLYVDVRSYDFNADDDSADNTRLLIGAEYYF